MDPNLIAGLADTGLNVIGGIAKSIFGAKQAREAREAIENYNRQNIEDSNVYADVSVSTLGADLQAEELARGTASAVGALQQGGVRGVVGGAGKVLTTNMKQSRQIGSDLDMQQKEIDRLRASDEAKIRDMQEQREREDLAALGQQLSAGQQNMWGGFGDVTKSVSSFTSGFTDGQYGNKGSSGNANSVNPFDPSNFKLADSIFGE